MANLKMIAGVAALAVVAVTTYVGCEMIKNRKSKAELEMDPSTLKDGVMDGTYTLDGKTDKFQLTVVKTPAGYMVDARNHDQSNIETEILRNDSIIDILNKHYALPAGKWSARKLTTNIWVVAEF